MVEFNKAIFVGAQTNRFYPVVAEEDQFIATPFLHSKKYTSNKKGTIQFLNCFSEMEINIKRNYILSLDLDIISSNGKEHDHARPISFARSEKNELTEVKNRIKFILSRIKDLKKKGISPKVITLSDSTFNGGGGYTPMAIAYLAGNYLRDELRKLFPKTKKPEK